MDNLEFWQTIKEYPNYSISDLGNIRNNKTLQILSKNKNIVNISLNGKSKKVHSLELKNKYFPDDSDEEWKIINDYPNYQISSLGRIKFKNRTITEGNDTEREYKIKILCNKTCKKSFYVHRLVAQAFLPNPDNLPQVNHKNCIKTDNRLENLEWISASENIQHAHKNGRIYSHKISIVAISKKTNEIVKIYESMRSAERDGFDRRHIYKCTRDSTKTHKSLFWRKIYADIEFVEDEIEGEIWMELKDSSYDEVNQFRNYAASNYGRVRNILSDKFISKIKKDGREYVSLNKNDKNKHFAISRLVIMTFDIPNPENKPQVDHIDGNPLNNELENLRWATSKENHANENTKIKKKNNRKSKS